MAVVRVGHICRIFPGAFTPTAAQEGGGCSFPEQPRALQTCPPFPNPVEDPQVRWALGHSVLACWHCNYFCMPSQCPPLLGCYPSASQKPFWASWCCWDLIHWLILNQGLCSFAVVLRTRAFHNVWGNEPGGMEVTKSLAGQEQEEESPEPRIVVVCEDRSPLGEYQQGSF